MTPHRYRDPVYVVGNAGIQKKQKNIIKMYDPGITIYTSKSDYFF